MDMPAMIYHVQYQAAGPRKKPTVMTACSLILNGPVLKVQLRPNVLNRLVGITLAQTTPHG